MDIGLPGMSGIDAARALKSRLPDAQIVMLTSFDDPRRIFEALRAGATGYVLKRASTAEIIAAIRDVHGGGAPMSSSIARRVVQQFAAPPLAPAPEVAALTEREREVLEALCEGRQYSEIGDWLGVSVNTVRKHVRNIYGKLQVNSRLEAIRKFESA
jgi:DNA-binding NarL/FixJ family response regulator